ncbi:hypothetical protein GPOL_c11710 [Gordonia polyisoprenivorans VH2]|uniref:Uncharacterized protein n=2 Tax=Gordonia polyisoprenivorans TaxID=84595 RepID=H6N2C0_GORPV|nr:hypothetical protein [Gordonia polyisoprenivorans]MBE7163214.1 hypothetical protein [Williamsia herbipolensis]AFA72233.1 hypothetical protein GPOL_c11710 [Gordonia polyisoprenivorans VH2]NKY00486.1 hypothetical protein [Gordonia polyisoprenivorans]QUD81653.1 hypothetical protein J8M97_17995 [Gordonia polyisoprenivorans]GAB24121.1 hypothetical protein GOPIP_063_00350 [Gordonia polyisoprenivorans NBRC 16320 = JCM 10675]
MADRDKNATTNDDKLHPGPTDNDGSGGMATREVTPELVGDDHTDDDHTDKTDDGEDT